MAPAHHHPTPLSGRTVLPAYGVLRAQGDDAAAFLQGQLTQDVLLAPTGEWRLAAYCSAQGRMLASFWMVRFAPNDVFLICRRDLIETTLKRLRMFVLRAKVVLSDASDAYDVYGLLGQAADPADVPAGGTCGRLPEVDGVARAVLLAPRAVESGTAAPTADEPLLAHWQCLQVRSGVAHVCAATSNLFVPQMLNYESVEGVNFKKGCYPGQEVVARSQYRGVLKRRAYVVHCPEVLAEGQEVFGVQDPEQPCGHVAAMAADPRGGWCGIVSVQVSAADAGGLTLGSAHGATLTVLPLPYPLIEI